MRNNKNRWVGAAEYSALSAWLKVNSHSAFATGDLLDSNVKLSNFLERLHALCSTGGAPDVAATAISGFLESHVQLESWLKIKQRYRRYKHRSIKGAGTIEVPESTKSKLLSLKEQHGLSTMNDVICELLTGTLAQSRGPSSSNLVSSHSVWLDEESRVAAIINAQPKEMQECFVNFISGLFADGYLQSKNSKRRSVEDMQARIRQQKIFKLLDCDLFL